MELGIFQPMKSSRLLHQSEYELQYDMSLSEKELVVSLLDSNHSNWSYNGEV